MRLQAFNLQLHITFTILYQHLNIISLLLSAISSHTPLHPDAAPPVHVGLQAHIYASHPLSGAWYCPSELPYVPQPEYLSQMQEDFTR